MNNDYYECSGCDNQMTGRASAHCSVCHNTFSSVKSFDLHRKDGKCLDPAKMKDKLGRLMFHYEREQWRRTAHEASDWFKDYASR